MGAGALAVALAACGGSNSSGGQPRSAAGTGSPWILGTTDTVTALDPAGSYDLGSSTLEYNLYQTLVTVPPNSTKIVGRRRQVVHLRRPHDADLHAQPG